MKKMIADGIEVLITRKRVKYLRLSVSPLKREARVSAPLFVSDEAIRQFVEGKTGWIRTQMEKYGNRPETPAPEYLTGEAHAVFGREYRLQVLSAKRPGIEFCGETIFLSAKPGSTVQERERILFEWYREQLKNTVPPLLEKWERIIGVKTNSFGVKNMKTRWGTCNSRAKRVWFNLQLAKMPPACLEYIVVHELVHLLETGHGDVFKGYMDRFLPDWRIRKKELNRK